MRAPALRLLLAVRTLASFRSRVGSGSDLTFRWCREIGEQPERGAISRDPTLSAVRRVAPEINIYYAVLYSWAYFITMLFSRHPITVRIYPRWVEVDGRK